MIIWIIASIVIILAIIAAVFAFWKKPTAPDYRGYYNIGIVWVPIGIVFWIVLDNIAFLGMGVVFLAIGLANKDKWGKKRRLTKREMRNQRYAVLGITILLIVGVLFFILLTELSLV